MKVLRQNDFNRYKVKSNYPPDLRSWNIHVKLFNCHTLRNNRCNNLFTCEMGWGGSEGGVWEYSSEGQCV